MLTPYHLFTESARIAPRTIVVILSHPGFPLPDSIAAAPNAA
jgi:hypothetical protein